jgi:gliding motility-associated-like protein
MIRSPKFRSRPKARMKNKIAIFFCFISFSSWSQIVVTSGGVLSITPTVSFYANGDFINNGQVLNNGSLYITGAWTNTGNYEAESGQVTFDGPSTQVINHNAQSFDKLVISGGGQKIFDADIQIGSELSLQNGILVSNKQSKIILSDSAKITGGSSVSFVQGPVYANGTGAKLFPVGINATYLPLSFTNVSGTSPVVSIEVIEPNPNKTVDASLRAVSPQWYWKVTTVSGTFSGSPVTLQLSNDSFSEPNNIVVAQASSLTDPFQSLGRGDFSGTQSNGTVTSKDPATLSILTTGEEILEGLTVYDGFSPNGDDKNQTWYIQNIEVLADTKFNHVTIYDRWGDSVYDVDNYNNTTAVFAGQTNNGTDLPSGVYFYKISFTSGRKTQTGYVSLKR